MKTTLKLLGTVLVISVIIMICHAEFKMIYQETFETEFQDPYIDPNYYKTFIYLSGSNYYVFSGKIYDWQENHLIDIDPGHDLQRVCLQCQNISQDMYQWRTPCGGTYFKPLGDRNFISFGGYYLTGNSLYHTPERTSGVFINDKFQIFSYIHNGVFNRTILKYHDETRELKVGFANYRLFSPDILLASDEDAYYLYSLDDDYLDKIPSFPGTKSIPLTDGKLVLIRRITKLTDTIKYELQVYRHSRV